MKNIILSLSLLVIPFVSFAETANVGIIQGIWFSQDTYFVGDTIRIYTAVQNNTGGDIEGEVDFFNNDEWLGTKKFTSLDGRITEVWMDSVATLGEHQFSVRIVELLRSSPGEEAENVTPRVIESENIIIVEHRPIPETGDDEAKEQEDFEEIPSWFAKFLENFFGTKADQGVSDDDSLESLAVKEPQKVRELGEQYPIVQKIIQPMNNFQNTVVTRTQNEQTRIQEKRSAPSEATGTDSENTPVQQPSWWFILYEGILFGIEWIFSQFVAVLLLTFFGIYLILKALFKIFGRRSMY